MIAERFHTLFAGLGRAHGTTNLSRAQRDDARGKLDGRSFIVKEPPTVAHWERHLAGSYGLGIFPLTDDGTCLWGAIDIDVYDIDHVDLENKCKTLKLPLVVMRTKSGGAHCFLFLTESAPAATVRNKLMDWATALGHGGVEVFPKQTSLASKKDFGNWLNMPYNAGTNTTRYAIRDGKAIPDPADFIEWAESCRVSADDLPSIEAQATGAFHDGPPCLQVLAKDGFPQGSRNNGLFNCAVYMRRKHKDAARDMLGKANQALMQPPLGEAEVNKVHESAGQKGYSYRCGEEPVKSVCNRQLCLTRQYGIGGSQVLNFSINHVIKLLTDPVTWIIDVNGTRIEVTSEVLLNQRAFRVYVAEALNKVPPMIKQPAWDNMINEKIQETEIQPAPVTASSEGELLTHLEDFCTDTNAMDKEELLNGMPWEDPEAGFTFFRSNDFRVYLETKRVRGWTNNKLWATFRRMGARHETMNVKGKRVQAWGVLSFAQQTEDFSIPKTQKEETY